MNFSEEQKQIIEAPILEKTVVMATAAAGKTATLTERVRFLIKSGVNPYKIVAITFTNNAAAEMRKRLGEDAKEGLFIGTLHSYANYLLISNGYSTDKIIRSEKFDELISLVSMYPEVIKEIDYLLCDESQDLNEDEFYFITEVLNPKSCLIVGDIRQCIYQFKGANPDSLRNLLFNEEYVVRELSNNYRNGINIIDFSNSIIKKMKDVPLKEVKPVRTTLGIIRKIDRSSILRIIRGVDPEDYGKWAILCRSNATVRKILAMLESNNIPVITFKQAQGDLTVLEEKMNLNSVKVLTIHSSKGLEFDNVILTDFWTKSDEDLKISYVGVTRARNKLFICTNKGVR